MSHEGFAIETIYVDSESGDDSVAVAERMGARVVELHASRTTAAMGRNAGWTIAQGSVVLFLDGDTVQLTANNGKHALHGGPDGFDRKLWRQDIAGSRAHAAMLGKQGIISAADAAAIDGGLAEIAIEIAAQKFSFSDALEDIHTNIEVRLTEKLGDAARRLHTARSRNDQVATDFKLFVPNEKEPEKDMPVQLEVVDYSPPARTTKATMGGGAYNPYERPIGKTSDTARMRRPRVDLRKLSEWIKTTQQVKTLRGELNWYSRTIQLLEGRAVNLAAPQLVVRLL